MRVLSRFLLKDSVAFFFLITLALLLGWAGHHLRWTSLSQDSHTFASGHMGDVAGINGLDPSMEGSSADLDISAMRQISVDRSMVILDARPTIFYNYGHIPSAISLPRDDFEVHYKILKDTLAPHRGTDVVVYCAGLDCQDSEFVARALSDRGFTRVHLFRGGWFEWQKAGLPEESRRE